MATRRGSTPVIIMSPPRRAPSRRGGGGGRRRSKPRPKPTRGQVAKAATSALILGVPLGIASAVGGVVLDTTLARKGIWQPPVIGWRGVFGLGLFFLGVLTKSPVILVAGTMLFGTSLPAATNALSRAALAPVAGLPGGASTAGLPGSTAGLPGMIARAVKAALFRGQNDDDDDDQDGLAEAVASGVVAGVNDELVEQGQGI